MKMFLCGQARLDSGRISESNFKGHGKSSADKEHDFGSTNGKFFTKNSGRNNKASDRKLKLSEESGPGNYLANSDPKMSDCSQTIQGCSESSDKVKQNLSSSRLCSRDNDRVNNILPTEPYLHNGNQSQQVLSTSTTVQPQLETVGKDSSENVKMRENSVFSEDCRVDICEKPFSIAISESLDGIKETVFQGVKSKHNDFCEKNKRNKISPSKEVDSDVRNSFMILEKQSVSASDRKLKLSEETGPGNYVANNDPKMSGCSKTVQGCSESSDNVKQNLSSPRLFTLVDGRDNDADNIILPTEPYLHNGNQSQQVLSTSTTVQLQLETVGKDSSEKVKMRENCKVDICEEPLSIAVSESEENTDNALDTEKETVFQGLKRKQNDFCEKNKKNKISPSKEVHSDVQKKFMIFEKQSVSVSLEGFNDLSENSVTDKEGISKGVTVLLQQHKSVPRKFSLNDYQKCIERSASLHLKCQRSSGTSSVPENSHDNSLPVITGAVSMASVSNMTENKESNNAFSEYEKFRMPVIKDVISLATSSNESEIGHQYEVAEVCEYSSSNDGMNEKNLPVISGVEDKAFHMWTLNELGLNESSLSEDGKQIPVIGKKVDQNVDISGINHTSISDRSDDGSKMNSDNLVLQGTFTQLAPPINKSNETATNYQAVGSVECIPPGKNLNATNITVTTNARPQMIISSAESATRIVCSTSASQSHQFTANAAVPKVSSCIDAWQKVFPWMLFSDSGQSFICKACEWGNIQFKSCVVFTLKDPADVYFVAQHLRFHQESESHKIISKKRDLVCNFYYLLYPALKRNMFKCLDDIIKDVTFRSGGSFPGPRETPQKEYYISYMISHIAECIEVNLLKSLAKSPVFSILVVEEKDVAILRWLNHKGEPEEHFFSSYMCCPGEVMPILMYLQKRQVDTSKLISYSHFPNCGTRTTPEAEMDPLPVRYPPLSICLKWLQKTDLLKDFFSHLDTLVRVCKSNFFWFSVFPDAYEIVKVEKPFSHGCVVNEKIVEFYFNNFNELKKICFKIYIETGSDDAHHFSRAEFTNFTSVQDFVSLLPRLHGLFIRENCNSSTLNKLIKEFRSLICGKVKALKDLASDECIALSLLDIYLSHTIISLDSQEQSIKNILTMKLRHVTCKDLHRILSRLTKDYQGGSAHCLQSLHALRAQLSKNRDCIITELLAGLIKEPELCKAFPHLFSLYQKISVLPFLHASTEQYMFNLAVSEMLLAGKVQRQLVYPLSLIILEDPPVGEIDINYLLDLWSKKWKLNCSKS